MSGRSLCSAKRWQSVKFLCHEVTFHLPDGVLLLYVLLVNCHCCQVFNMRNSRLKWVLTRRVGGSWLRLSLDKQVHEKFLSKNPSWHTRWLLKNFSFIGLALVLWDLVTETVLRSWWELGPELICVISHFRDNLSHAQLFPLAWVYEWLWWEFTCYNGIIFCLL